MPNLFLIVLAHVFKQTVLVFFFVFSLSFLYSQEEWQILQSPTTNTIASVYAQDSIVYIAGGNGSRNEFHKSSDFGKTWKTIRTDNLFESIHFLNKDIGYASDYKGIVKTIDGGNTWNRLFDNESKSKYTGLTEVFFVNETTGYFCGGSYTSARALKTSDGGENWVDIVGDLPSHLNAVFFFDSERGYVFGAKGYIGETVDGGQSWIHHDSGTSESLNSVFFVDENNGYAAGSNGIILHTVDGGANWVIQESGVEYSLSSICFVNAQTGYAAGGVLSYEKSYPEPLDQVILKTEDAGATWVQQSSGSNDAIIAMSFNENNRGYAVGHFGAVLTLEPSIDQTLELQAGWNLISLYVSTSNMTPEAIWGDEIENVSIIKNFEKSWQLSNPQELNSLTELEAGAGYFVYAKNDCQVVVRGHVKKEASKEIKQGWNLWGIQSTSSTTVEEALPVDGLSLIKDFDQFWQPSSNGTLKHIQPGKGYLIHKP